MKVELTIDRTKKLPDGALPALERELLKRLNGRFDECNLNIKRAGADSLTVFGADKDDKKTVEQILQETWESADDWFY
ncbi:DNA-damage-inducible protein I [compost metagenome]